MSPIETVAARALLWASVGAATAVPALVVPAAVDPMLPGTIHLVLLGVFALALTAHLAPHADTPWFAGVAAAVGARAALSWTVVVAAVAGAVAVAAVPTAAALRYDASMQFLVLLTAGTIGWQTAATALGGRRRFGPRVGAVLGAVPIVVGVVVFRAYLDAVGVGPGGAWIVDGARFTRLVLPAEAVVAVAAFVVFSLGVARVGESVTPPT